MLTLQQTLQAQMDSNQAKLATKTLKTLINAFWGGLFIAIVTHVYLVMTYGLSPLNPTLGKVIGAFLFPIGIWMVVLTKSELFTGNHLLSMNFIAKKSSFPPVLKNWFLVYVGNFFGSVSLVLTVYYSGIYQAPEFQSLLLKIVHTKLSYGFFSLILLGIFCNILVCLSVFLSFSSNSMSGKFIALWAPVVVFVLAGFEHSIANMFYLPLAYLLDGSISISEIILHNLLPVTIGNIFGGFLLSLYFVKK